MTKPRLPATTSPQSTLGRMIGRHATHRPDQDCNRLPTRRADDYRAPEDVCAEFIASEVAIKRLNSREHARLLEENSRPEQWTRDEFSEVNVTMVRCALYTTALAPIGVLDRRAFTPAHCGISNYRRHMELMASMVGDDRICYLGTDGRRLFYSRESDRLFHSIPVSVLPGSVVLSAK